MILDGKFYISRKEQASLTKKKIFDTTLLLIKKKGYGKITIREICQNAEISIGTFYLYFSSKDEILLEIYEKVDRNLTPPAEGDSSATIIPLICSYFHDYLKEVTLMFEKELFREVYRISLSSGDNRFLSAERPLYQAVLAALTASQGRGETIQDVKAPDLCYKLHIFVQAYIFQWLTDDNLCVDYLTAYCIDDLQKYLTLYIHE